MDQNLLAKKSEKAPLGQLPVWQLKKYGTRFIQNEPCFKLPSELMTCRECEGLREDESADTSNVCCRFIEFRKLKYTRTKKLISVGFSTTETDASDIDNKLWLPDTANPPSDLDLETSLFLLMQLGDHFCDLVQEEKGTLKANKSGDRTILWKRFVNGVREMCDVCATTLFNYHWSCRKCGFVVCLDCYKESCFSIIIVSPGETPTAPEDDDAEWTKWLRCTPYNNFHSPQHLMLTQIIPDDCLLNLGKMVHEMRDLWSIEKFCDCPGSEESKINNTECREAVKRILAKNMNKKQSSSSKEYSSSEEKDPFALRKLLLRPVASTVPEKEKGTTSDSSTVPEKEKETTSYSSTIPEKEKETTSASSENNDHDPLLSKLKHFHSFEQGDSIQNEKNELKHFFRRYVWQNKGRQPAPIRIMTQMVSTLWHPYIPHSWLCGGKLLRLNDPVCKDNFKLFQEQWRRGQPVMVSNVSRLLNEDLWSPEALARDFGEENCNLINCVSGCTVPNQPTRQFWNGFEDPSKRLKDFNELPMLLKLKDWPPSDDFAETLPARFQDFMQALPLQEYTRRSGKLNLASRLPDCFVRPDLGPKMYNAYGKPLPANKGTTNLHLDVSDAVNVLVYVGVSHDGDPDQHFKDTLDAIDEAGCDFLTKRRVRCNGELPGALWHIYHACDADKIRDLLNKATIELGGRLEPDNDPIHDQSGYLDGPLRFRLYKEYGVEGYAILQCEGDAVFIPAGAPHQVRNINNCIKVAEDFVSPENVVHCSHLTQEFRGLSNNHTNHEDKLQIKNLIYHSVKDALCALGSIVNKELARRVIDDNNHDADGNSEPEAE